MPLEGGILLLQRVNLLAQHVERHLAKRRAHRRQWRRLKRTLWWWRWAVAAHYRWDQRHKLHAPVEIGRDDDTLMDSRPEVASRIKGNGTGRPLPAIVSIVWHAWDVNSLSLSLSRYAPQREFLFFLVTNRIRCL